MRRAPPPPLTTAPVADSQRPKGPLFKTRARADRQRRWPHDFSHSDAAQLGGTCSSTFAAHPTPPSGRGRAGCTVWVSQEGEGVFSMRPQVSKPSANKELSAEVTTMKRRIQIENDLYFEYEVSPHRAILARRSE